MEEKEDINQTVDAKDSKFLDAEQTATFWIQTDTNNDIHASLRKQIKKSPLSQNINIKSYIMSHENEAETDKNNPDYEILEKLGEGGMGEIFSARQVSMDRTVAVKMIKAKKNENNETQERFLSEAAVTGELDHPNIVPIHSLGSNEKGKLFYAMKKVNGKPWSKKIANLSKEENLDILLKVADAIAFAHSKNIIHMDLKPENVMLGEYGEVYVMDWGLAASIGEPGKAKLITETDAIGGTPAYMPPEIAAGDVENIDFSSDIYLLGAILFNIISGKTPHTGKTCSTCLAKAADNIIQDPCCEDPYLPIAYCAMETLPANRYKSILDLKNTLIECRSHSDSHEIRLLALTHHNEAKSSQNYESYAEAIFAYKEALRLWENNTIAKEGLASVQLDFSKTAFENGDYDLSMSLLQDEHISHQHFKVNIIEASKNRKKKERRAHSVSLIAKGLALSIFIILGISVFWVSKEKSRALQAEKNAQSALGQERAMRKEIGELQDRLEEALDLTKNTSETMIQFETSSIENTKASIALSDRTSLQTKELNNLDHEQAPMNEASVNDTHKLKNEIQEHLKSSLKLITPTVSAYGSRERSTVKPFAKKVFKNKKLTENKSDSAPMQASALDKISIAKTETDAEILDTQLSKESFPMNRSKGKAAARINKKNPIMLLYKSALMQFDLDKASKYANHMKNKGSRKLLNKTGENCICDIDDLKLLLNSVRKSFQKQKGPSKKLTLKNGHTITGDIKINNKGKITLMQEGYNSITKTILDLDPNTIEKLLLKDKECAKEDIPRLIALLNFASGDIAKAKKQFSRLQNKDKLKEHHETMMKW